MMRKGGLKWVPGKGGDREIIALAIDHIPPPLPFSPSDTEKMAPHFGHRTFVSFDTPAHPEKKVIKQNRIRRIIARFRFLLAIIHPPCFPEMLSNAIILRQREKRKITFCPFVS
jgi:hypothetical protein